MFTPTTIGVLYRIIWILSWVGRFNWSGQPNSGMKPWKHETNNRFRVSFLKSSISIWLLTILGSTKFVGIMSQRTFTRQQLQASTLTRRMVNILKNSAVQLTSICKPNTYTCTHACTLTHTHTLSLSHTHTLAHTSYTITHTQSHTHTNTHTLNHTHTNTHTLNLTHTHTHKHTHSITHIHIMYWF